MKKIIIFLHLLILSIPVIAQNTILISDYSAEAETITAISLEIENSDNFSAFQTDIILPTGIQYVDQSAELTSRADDHVLSASLLQDNLLRVFVYSLSNAVFSGNAGSVLNFEIELGTTPGTFDLELNNSIIADTNSANILTGFTNGTITILAPDIELNTEMLDFGDVPLLTTEDRSVIISNTGNQVLSILDITINNAFFEILGNTQFSINPNNQQTITIRFHSDVKGEYQNTLQIISDDPDENTRTVELNAIAFAVNELHTGAASCSSGESVDISFSIENMESFSAFQFDLSIPNSLSFSDISTTLSGRSVDHVSSANFISDALIRIVAYSINNTVFTGNNGDVITLNLIVEGIGGNYPLTLQDVIISDVNGNNIVSDSFGAYLNIEAPNISGTTFLDFGEISILDAEELPVTINNTGDAELVIYQTQFTSSSFTSNFALPATVQPQQQIDIPVEFSNLLEGNYNGIMKIFSNDPNDNIFEINLEGTTFSPNYITVCDTLGYPDSLVTVIIDIENYDQFVAFQFDLNFPAELSYIVDSAQLSERAVNHLLMESVINDNQLRLISYSPDQSSFLGNSGSVITLDFLIAPDCIADYLNMQISEAILANSNSENILQDVNDGQIEIVYVPSIENPILDFSFPEDTQDTSIDLNSVFEIGNNSTLSYSYSGNNNIAITISYGIVTLTPNQDWTGSELITFTATSTSSGSVSEDVIITVTPVNDTPVIISFLPEELEFTVIQDSIVTFSVVAEDVDSDLTYEWLVDEELQTEIASTFEHQFSNIGTIEITSIVSDEEYDIETSWNITVEPESSSGEIIPIKTTLYQNYPNPFNPSTTIKYNLKENANVIVEIFNIKGQKINTLVNKNEDAGYHSVIWDGTDNVGNPISSGIYLYQLSINDRIIDMRKCILLE